ncbi:Uncharacterised protein [Citrobacter koseri]|nr:Uncharacterised protein [Citrobacter koseri]
MSRRARQESIPFRQYAVCSFGQHDITGAQRFIFAHDAADSAIFNMERFNRNAVNALYPCGLGLSDKPGIEAGSQ